MEGARERREARKQLVAKLTGTPGWETPEQIAAQLTEEMGEPIEETARKAKAQIALYAESLAEHRRRWLEDEREFGLPSRFIRYELASARCGTSSRACRCRRSATAIATMTRPTIRSTRRSGWSTKATRRCWRSGAPASRKSRSPQHWFS